MKRNKKCKGKKEEDGKREKKEKKEKEKERKKGTAGGIETNRFGPEPVLKETYSRSKRV